MDFIYRNKPIKEVGFFGFGESTRGIHSYLRERFPALAFTIRDEKKKDIPTIFSKRFLGDKAYSEVCEDVLFLSPSVRRDTEFFVNLEKRGVIISSDAEFFFENSKADVYAVTGSDGKSTTVSIARELLCVGYKSAEAIGNIGYAMTPYIDDGEDTALICELSSFQLMALAPKTRRAYITNITKNHLDFHKSFEEYIEAKENVLKNTDEPIINFDCEISRGFADKYPPYAVISMRHTEGELRKKVKAEIYLTRSDGYITLSGRKILPISDIRLKGEYNLYNFAAAIALSHGKCDEKKIISTAKNFEGLTHRYQVIHEALGVRYVDSSIDSTPTRTLATLTRAEGEVILLLGGRSKNLPYEPLAKALPENVVTVIAMGENAEEIEAAFKENEAFSKRSTPFIRFDDFYDGLAYAIRGARSGQTVLLSPASTSYDRFRDYRERGEKFRDFVIKYTEGVKPTK